MQFTTCLKAVITMFLVGALSASAAPILTISDGILTGARNVEVKGKFYAVNFIDGSCNSLFRSCSVTAFAFTKFTDGIGASQALLDQVFVDGPLGSFDSRPELTRGCTNTTVCEIVTPWDVWGGTNVNTGFADNYGTTALDWAGATPWGVGTDFSTLPAYSWAVFSPAVVTIPEPSTIWLFALGVFMLAARATLLQTNLAGIRKKLCRNRVQG